VGIIGIDFFSKREREWPPILNKGEVNNEKGLIYFSLTAFTLRKGRSGKDPALKIGRKRGG